MQHYHTAMILLRIADTASLKTGIGHRASRNILQAEVAYHAALCSGSSHRETLSNRDWELVKSCLFVRHVW